MMIKIVLFLGMLSTGMNGRVFNLPEKFLGEWKLDRTENLEEYMIARGINVFQRKMVMIASVTRVYQRNANEMDLYDTFILSTFKNAKWYKWRLGEPFNATYVDDNLYEILFDYNPIKDLFTETHINLSDKSIPADICEHSLNEKGELIQKVESNGVVGRRYFSRITK